MQLILIQKVKGLGDLGDKVDVRPGYARNYLVPHGKAVAATKDNIEQFEQRRADYVARADEMLGGAQARRERMDGVKVAIQANASTEGKLYGSVGPREVADAFTAIGIPLEKSEVLMGEGPLRRTGEYDVIVSLHADVQATVKVVIEAEA